MFPPLAPQSGPYAALSAPLEKSSKFLLEPAENSNQTDAKSGAQGKDKLKEAFQDFVGQTFFSEMLKSLRSTEQPSKYFHGGRAEEIFKGQFDQVLAEELSDASASKIADPMYELFMLKRQA